MSYNKIISEAENFFNDKFFTEKPPRKPSLIESVRNLMETLNLTAKQAMDALKIPADKQE